MIAFAEIGFREQCDDVHKAHQASDMLGADCVAIMVIQMVGHLAITPGWPFRMGSINKLQNVRVLLVFAVYRVVIRLVHLTVKVQILPGTP